jgi:murein DD-endopeptidase MepM/ murein hydrolase activator NlpD
MRAMLGRAEGRPRSPWPDRRRYGALLLALTLAAAGAGTGCAYNAGSAPLPAAMAKPSGEVVVIRKGDTVYSIARRYNVAVRDVIAVNQLQAPYDVAIGQHVLVPITRVHVVASGETLYSVARRYQVDQSELTRLNDLRAPYTIRVGQHLRVPAPQLRDAETMVAARDAGAASAPGAVVESDVAEPAERDTAAGGTSNGVAPPRDPGKSEAEKQMALANPPPLSSRKFLWPVDGKVLLSFGSKGSGLHNDGVNIAAPAGTVVRAAENGVVAYAGNELRGFGNLLLVKHDGGWMTAYAHNASLLVRRGDQVKRGQPIARVGQSGNVSTPQLHFELRRGKSAVDPIQHLDGELRVATLNSSSASK